MSFQPDQTDDHNEHIHESDDQPRGASSGSPEDAIEHAEQVADRAAEDDASQPDADDVYVADEPDRDALNSSDDADEPESLLAEVGSLDADDGEPEPEPEPETEPETESDTGATEKPKAKKKATRKKTAKKTTKKTAKKTAKKAASKKRSSRKKKTDDELGDEPGNEAAAVEAVGEPELAESEAAESEAAEPEAEEPQVRQSDRRTPQRSEAASKTKKTHPTRMVINYAPSEECRIALVENNQLEEYHSERMDAISRVNNIYVGRVANIESGIQAAFVDFGIGDSGFLHVTDLHPRYFPGAEQDDSERVGRKTPRRERPPIQQALKRGQEIIVQVLKEGVGTKGPTLTSYLSIPGRYLVMMPQMDQVGVSRKVEDEQIRRDMRKTLDGLDLPSNFGFILRTAGIGKTKTELKRDLAYLQRLWKDLDKRRRTGRAPRLLYSESDLLLRALRDFLTPEIDEIVLDNEHALRRASQFLKIAAPRSSVRLRRYTGPAPVFEVFGIEEQLELMQSREVPLPSGGRLVIDQTEAVVAIDVNSGKMRSAKDSETNALRTNLEAVDEICRQLRLRDMGGIVINDMIDMRASKNRKMIENRFKDRLKRDRARSSVASISPFGILEMTRQRMRGSLHSQIFTDCPTCHGRGSVKRPSSVASESIRTLASLLSRDKVHRVELVVGARVAGELLSKKRRALARLEQITGKQVLVRVMDMSEPDRTVLYAYGPNGQDIDIARLPKPPKPDQWLEVWTDPNASATDADWVDAIDEAEEVDVVEEVVDPLAEQDEAARNASDEQPTGGKKKRRRRRRGRGGSSGDESGNESVNKSGGEPSTERRENQPEPNAGEQDQSNADSGASSDESEAGGDQPKKKRRRRRRGRGGGGEGNSEGGASEDRTEPQADGGESRDAADTGSGETSGEAESSSDSSGEGGQPKKKRRRRRRGRGGGGEGTNDGGASGEPNAGSGSGGGGSSASASNESSGSESQSQAEVKPKRRSVYGSSRRKLTTAELAKVAKRKD